MGLVSILGWVLYSKSMFQNRKRLCQIQEHFSKFAGDYLPLPKKIYRKKSKILLLVQILSIISSSICIHSFVTYYLITFIEGKIFKLLFVISNILMAFGTVFTNGFPIMVLTLFLISCDHIHHFTNDLKVSTNRVNRVTLFCKKFSKFRGLPVFPFLRS